MADNEKVEEYITEIKLLDKNDNKKKIQFVVLICQNVYLLYVVRCNNIIYIIEDLKPHIYNFKKNEKGLKYSKV